MMCLIGERWFNGSLQAVFYNLGIIIWVVAEIIIFTLTGKKSGKSEKKAKSFDQLSIYAVMAGNIFSCIIAVWGAQYLQVSISGTFAWIGIVVLYAGVFFRCFAVWTLRKFFTVTVKIKDGHKIVKSGPYAYLRHPAYTGSILALLGMQLGVRSLIGLVLVFGVAILVYSYRIYVEEKALVANFGRDYVEYVKETKKIIPFIY